MGLAYLEVNDHDNAMTIDKEAKRKTRQDKTRQDETRQDKTKDKDLVCYTLLSKDFSSPNPNPNPQQEKKCAFVNFVTLEV